MIEIMDWVDGVQQGWVEGKFYLRSAGGNKVRVYTAACNDIPSFAFGWTGAPPRPAIHCPYCGRVNTVLVNGKYCRKCGTEVAQ